MDELKKQLASKAEALLQEQDLVLLCGGRAEGDDEDINFSCRPNVNCDLCTINYTFVCGR